MTALLTLLAGMSAAGVKYVAVVETDVDASSGASADLNPAEVREITAELRRQATKNLPSGRYSVMTSETVQSMGGAVLEECADENCVITLGSKIGADYIVRGTVSKFKTMFTLAVELYETENGTLVVSSEAVRSENLVELLRTAAAASAEMYREFAGTQAQTAGGQQKDTRTTVKTQSTESYASNTRNNNQSDNQYDDFTESERWKTFGLNLLPGGFGSFLIMKDNVGGYVLLSAGIVCITGFFFVPDIDGFDEGTHGGRLIALYTYIGAGIFNIIRSATYHKPNQSSPAANTFKPYDGLKLAVFPTQSGDFKVSARYDYSF